MKCNGNLEALTCGERQRVESAPASAQPEALRVKQIGSYLRCAQLHGGPRQRCQRGRTATGARGGFAAV